VKSHDERIPNLKSQIPDLAHADNPQLAIGNRQLKGMVDVSGKHVTARTAKARATIALGEAAFDALRRGDCPKGDVLATAKVAAIQAVKSTPAIIPMCHPILIEGIEVDFLLDEVGQLVTATVSVRSSGKTGVEMEALHGVAAACLTIYDMLKYTGKDMTISDIRLLEKTGGQSGDYKRPG
jgi:cyclic pyranopterin phosphate synthase